jgi:hypothetical protein
LSGALRLVRAAKKKDSGAFKLRAEQVTQNQWRDFGDVTYFEALIAHVRIHGH